ncbi:MAG: hypothetical protein ACOX7N_08880 [Lawsonibacter sp.]|jgi:hypothetical protein
MLLIDNLIKAIYATIIGKNVNTMTNIPIVQIDTWCWTPESCLNFTKPTRQAVYEVFNSLDQETQKRFTFTPTRGEWTQRARFWKEHLRDLPPNQYHEAMSKILNWCTRCVKRRLEEGAVVP